ncbi:ribonuclease III [Mucisphaera calidilacus]|uniref:Ribonuclease 3 n=1 Tax=Mucisphaera calidilacus TaxID=2527982 RepID=A0A518BXY6_9BACT|nr:ribonuclease III [Mucisphaera calidilacus]QDU71816.1 Ribonuclease 3 [Mucisphaera calidilacus]
MPQVIDCQNSNMDHELINDCQQRLGHQFDDRDLLKRAFTHASSIGDRLESNERLEFLGDAVLGQVVCEYLFHELPSEQEGELTKIKSAVVSRRACAKVSRKLGLPDCLKLGKGMEAGTDLPTSVAAAVFESVIAAIYLDAGYPAAKQFILHALDDILEEATNSLHQHNFKSVLQHYTQRHLPGNPAYILLDEKGPDHAKAFEVCVEIGGHKYTSAWANSKKEAEQKAALQALQDLGIATQHNNGSIEVHEDRFDDSPPIPIL